MNVNLMSESVLGIPVWQIAAIWQTILLKWISKTLSLEVYDLILGCWWMPEIRNVETAKVYAII